MKQFFIFLFAISLQANAQTIINYGAWTGTASCNAFSAATNVPVTINGSAGTVTHLSTVAQPKWDATNNVVELDGAISNGQPLGTEYRIAYSFALRHRQPLPLLLQPTQSR